jgi:putative transposase
MVPIEIVQIQDGRTEAVADKVSMALAELVRKAEANGDVDFLKEGVRVLSQALMEVEVAQHIGAERYERSGERSGQRNGYRERTWDTRVGSLELKVPRVRDGSYFPSLLEPRKRAERALVAVVREAYVQGVSTRRVDDLVKALGLDGISRSQVSRLCEELDGEVERFRQRKLDGPFPYVWLDATFVKVRQDPPCCVDGYRHRHRRQRQRPAGSAGAGRRSQRGWRLLAEIPAQPRQSRFERS